MAKKPEFEDMGETCVFSNVTKSSAFADASGVALFNDRCIYLRDSVGQIVVKELTIEELQAIAEWSTSFLFNTAVEHNKEAK